MKTSFYIAEINIPSSSAYSIHVFQMCNFLSKKKENVKLLVPYLDKKNLNKIKKNYGVKYNFEIISFFRKKKELNFFKRIYFGFKCFNYLKKSNINLVLSRSVITSLILASFKIRNYIEIHTELKGITKYFFSITKLNFISKNLKFILINKYLLNFFKFSKNKYIILDDAVNNNLFRDKKNKKYKKTCAYFGSLTKGKALEIILKVSKICKNINFHIYGDLDFIDTQNLNMNQKNVKFFNYVKYYKVPELMSKYDVLLMPYLKNVSVRSKNLDVGKYMSPLKLFEYLAMSKIIIASKLVAYSHILKNNKNAILIDSKNIKEWAKKIILVFKNLKKFKYLRKGALKTAEKHTWEKRVDTILKNNNLF